MTRRSFLPACSFVAVGFAVFALASDTPANAQTETIIHTFRGTNLYDGIQPLGGLVADSKAALYGVANGGGKYREGVVYKLVPPSTEGGAWMEDTLYPFRGSYKGGNDGSGPSGNIVFTYDFSHNGKIYGTTQGGGLYGGGTVYELSRQTTNSPWTENVIYNFGPRVEPVYGVIAGPKGRLYGTTLHGGHYNLGTIFELSPPSQVGGAWNQRILYSFNVSGGESPSPSGLVMDGSGALYGTDFYEGTIFRLTPPSGGVGPWTESVLYTFSTAASGLVPSGGLVLDSRGALYGLALEGGLYGGGVAYQLVPPTEQGGAWTENVLYSFGLGSDSSFPIAAMAFDNVGALYGVSEFGGADTCSPVYNGCGTVFKISPPSIDGGAWTEQVLHVFTGGDDGAWIQGFSSPLVAGTTIFGTTLQGGTGFCEDANGDASAGCGTVFQVTQP